MWTDALLFLRGAFLGLNGVHTTKLKSSSTCKLTAKCLSPLSKLPSRRRAVLLALLVPIQPQCSGRSSDQRQLLQVFPELDGLWTWGCGDTADVVANASKATIQACNEVQKYSAGSISAPYSPHRAAALINGTRAWSNVRYFNGNGAKGVITTWEAHIASQPDFVIYTTWDDLAEHHLGPYNNTYWDHCRF